MCEPASHVLVCSIALYFYSLGLGLRLKHLTRGLDKCTDERERA